MTDDKKRPTGKFLRLKDDLNNRINTECDYLGVTRNAWITMTLDNALRRAQIERSVQYDPDVEKKINAQLDFE